MEFFYFGVKVIYFCIIGFFVLFNILCLIKNMGNFEGKGIYIDGNINDDGLKVKGIINLDNVVMFNVFGFGM